MKQQSQAEESTDLWLTAEEERKEKLLMFEFKDFFLPHS